MGKIEKMVDEYGELKAQEKEIKDKLKTLNDEIKTYMGHNNLDTLEGAGFVASYTLRKKEDFDEQALIELFKKALSKDVLANVVKTKEYVDSDALESAVYHGEVNKPTLLAMDKCKTVKRTPTLNINVRKGGDRMYISPYWLGVATVVGLELLVLVGVAIVSVIKDKLKARRK